MAGHVSCQIVSISEPFRELKYRLIPTGSIGYHDVWVQDWVLITFFCPGGKFTWPLSSEYGDAFEKAKLKHDRQVHPQIKRAQAEADADSKALSDVVLPELRDAEKQLKPLGGKYGNHRPPPGPRITTIA